MFTVWETSKASHILDKQVNFTGAGASLDNRAATLVCWLGCSGKPGKATRLFIEAAFTAIYCTGDQCCCYTRPIKDTVRQLNVM